MDIESWQIVKTTEIEDCISTNCNNKRQKKSAQKKCAATTTNERARERKREIACKDREFTAQ